jgi:hypothetical protein
MKRIWAGVTAFGSIIKSALTGPDGSSWAPGRIMGFGLFSVSQCLVIRATQSVLAKGPTVADWAAFLPAVAAFEGVVCAIAIGLVLGMAPTDSGGKWWGRDASPPPPPGR